MNTEDFPEASVQHTRVSAWLLPLILFLILTASAGGLLLYYYLQPTGPRLTLHFPQGHGLKIGDSLRYRGINIGEVTHVVLAPNLDRITVTVQVWPNAAAIASANSQFWIVRPEVDLTGAAGLETVLGANYINVLPGVINHPDDPPHTEFAGLEAPPALAILEAGGLTVTLLTPNRGSLKANAPVFYREIKVGTILSVDLTPDSSAVRAKVYIQPDYTGLIREHTKFWKTSGFQVGLGWTGLSMNVNSLQSLLLGGITLAVPPEPGELAHQEQQFRLYDEPLGEWLKWRPFTPLASAERLSELPAPVLAELTWQQRNMLRITVTERRQAWVVPLADGFLGPQTIFNPPADEVLAGTAQLKIAGTAVAVQTPPLDYGHGLAFLAQDHALSGWSQQRHPDQPESSLVIADPTKPPLYLAKYHLETTEDGYWRIAEEVPVSEQWHGAAVVSEADNALLGLLLVEDGVAKVGVLQ